MACDKITAGEMRNVITGAFVLRKGTLPQFKSLEDIFASIYGIVALR
jgi:hypothetical protein